MENVIIVGSGPAGLTAALYCARAELDPLVLEGLQPGGQLTTTTEVENYPGFPESIGGMELVGRMKAQAERFGARFERVDVTGCDFSGDTHKLTLSDDRELASRTIVIASGASARYLGLESEQKLMGKGVSGCATCDGAFYRGEKVVVIGGGDTAMEDALFLTRMCETVTVIHRRDAFRASKIMAERVVGHEKIDVAWDSVVEDVLGENAVEGVRIRDVKTDEVREIAATGFFVAIGHTPNTVPFKGALDMHENGYLVAENTRTSVKGVFAAGDVQDHVYRQAVTAAGSGCMAALEVERYLSAG